MSTKTIEVKFVQEESDEDGEGPEDKVGEGSAES